MSMPIPSMRIFQSTPPSREATCPQYAHFCVRIVFQSTPPSREATPPARQRAAPQTFQSTPPSREATIRPRSLPDGITFQSTPPSREATRISTSGIRPMTISIHASLAGGDLGPARWPGPERYFNPRLPRGRRRYVAPAIGEIPLISIHASLAGGDSCWDMQIMQPRHFNPRLPRGRRQQDIPLFCLWNTTYGNSCEFVVRDAAFPSLLWRKSGEFRLVLVRTDRENGRNFRFARLGILPMICF